MPRLLAHSGQIVMLLPFSVVRYLTSEASILRPQEPQVSMALRRCGGPLKSASGAPGRAMGAYRVMAAGGDASEGPTLGSAT